MTTHSLTTASPDIRFQIAPGLTPAQREGLLSSLLSSLPHGSEVRTGPAADAMRIGLWLVPAADATESAARETSLAAFDPLGEGETFGASVSADLISRLAQIAWYQAPQHVDDQGRVRANGPIHLTGFSLELAAPDRIVTTHRRPRRTGSAASRIRHHHDGHPGGRRLSLLRSPGTPRQR
jgi:hypothetical protein